MPPFAIRSAIPADVPPITQVVLRVRGEASPALPRLRTVDEATQWVEETLASHEVHVAEVEGAVVGFSALKGSEVKHLYVHPCARGRGVGSALVEHAKQGHDRLDVHTFRRSERAREFCYRHGFRLVELGDGSHHATVEPDARYFWTAR
ncbi:N-acetyltransferase [Longimycelium tulufanense]|uniref:N-acetyltransferase n=1 Tax=Longimycelium tulufanense TaxID=907463 RepID=A0A8J3CB97_9PSEU|nr:GNAT family N-acetyltransferase [Longimycelium tulufanense]GGM69018.1 N-acetyltransferase [Longimycelium tulufanense]